GIIENYALLKEGLCKDAYQFQTETDTEVAAHLIHRECLRTEGDFRAAVLNVVDMLEGAYALAVIDRNCPDRIMVARSGSPLVIGIGIGENFIASDPSALGQVTDSFIYLEEGDIAEIRADRVMIWNARQVVERPVVRLSQERDDVVKGQYRHYML